MKSKKGLTGLLFVLPFFVLFAVFQVYPILFTLFLSFTKFDGVVDPQWNDFGNYIRFFTVDVFGEDARFSLYYLNTWKIWLPNIITQISLALFCAILMTNIRLRIKGVGLFRAIFYFPNLVTAASLAILFSVLTDWQYGALNQLLFGDNKASYINWVGADGFRFQMIVAGIQTWIWFGNTMILIMAGLTSVPQSYYEAAWMDGASAVTTFFKITMPLLQPIMVYIVITSLIGGMQIFDIPYAITTPPGAGGIENSMTTATVYTYQRAFGSTKPNFGYAAALSYIQFLLILVFSLLYFRSIKKQDQGEN
jgi:cellobiose transport system permease protein